MCHQTDDDITEPAYSTVVDGKHGKHRLSFKWYASIHLQSYQPVTPLQTRAVTVDALINALMR